MVLLVFWDLRTGGRRDARENEEVPAELRIQMEELLKLRKDLMDLEKELQESEGYDKLYNDSALKPYQALEVHERRGEFRPPRAARGGGRPQ